MENLGTIGFGFDSSELQKGQQAFDNLATSARKAGDAMAQSQQGADRVKQSAQAMTEATSRHANATAQAARAATQAAQAQKAAVDDSVKSTAQAAQSSATHFQSITDRIRGFVQNYITQAKQLGSSGQHFTGVQQSVSSLAGTMGLGANTGLAGSMANVGRGASSMIGFLGPMAGAVTVAVGAIAGLAASSVAAQVQLAKVQDRFQLYEARAKVVTGSTLEARDAIQALTDSSIKNGIALDTSIGVFTRFIQVRNQLGATTQDIVKFTEIVQKIGIVSGASSQETGSALQQMSQALASGKLNGDELRSIMENMPAIARILADGLGVSVGQLRVMGAEGKLTAEKVFPAILAAQQKVQEQFEKMPKTAERAFQSMADQATLLAKALGDRLNSSAFVRSLAEGMQSALQVATNAVKPPSLEDQIREIDKQLEALNQRAQARVSTRAQQAAQDTALAVTSNPNLLGRSSRTSENRDLAEQNALLEQRAKLQGQVNGLAREDAEGKIARAQTAAVLPVTKAVELEKELNESAKRRTQTLERIQQIQNAIANLQAPESRQFYAEDDRQRLIKGQQTALQALQAELVNTGSEYEKLARKINDSGRDAARNPLNFNTGQLELLSRAREIAESSTRDFRPTSQAEVLNSLLSEQAVKIRASSNEYRTQIQLIDLQRQAIGKTRDEVLLLEGDAKAIEEISKLVFTGNATTDRKLFDAISALVQGMTTLKRAEDELATARQRQDNEDYYAREAAGLSKLEKGAYAAARAVAEVEAAIAERGRKGAGAQVLERFDFEQQAKGAAELAKERQQLQALQDQFQTAGNPLARLRRERQRELEQITRDSPPEEAGGGLATERVRNRLRSFDTQDRTAAADQLASVREEITYTEQLIRLQGLNSEEYAVQVALLNKRRELQKSGIDLSQAEQDQILADTGVLARRNSRLDEQKRLAEQFRGIWQNAANGIQQAFASSFEEMLNTGKVNSQTLSNLLTQTVNKIIAQMWSAMIFDPLIKNAQKALGLDVIPVGGGSPGSGGGGGRGGSGGGILSGVGGVLSQLFQGNFGNLAAAYNSAAFISDVAAAESIGITLPFMAGGRIRAGQRAMVGEVGPEVVVPFGGFRAGGGPVSGRSAYVVGEKGPEIMVPKESGFVIPNHKLRDFGMDRWVAGRRAMGGLVQGGLPYLVGEQGAEGFVSGRTSSGGRRTSPVQINFTVNTPNADSFRAAQSHISSDLVKVAGRMAARNS